MICTSLRRLSAVANGARVEAVVSARVQQTKRRESSMIVVRVGGRAVWGAESCAVTSTAELRYVSHNVRM